jgi:NAD(P)-dependent dehydrogenase (short-subunit alcohol dehydrogenase family)
VADVNKAGGEETEALIAKNGGRACFQACDVSDAAQVKALVARAVNEYGRLDFAHNNAGINSLRIDEWDGANFARSLAVNLTGVMLCIAEEVPAMLKTGGGAIVNTASINGLMGNPAQPAYTAGKHGVVGLTRSAALKWARQGIRINCICPGPTDTAMVAEMMADPRIRAAIEQMNPMGRLARPEEMAGAVMWLCSDQASFVTGHPLVVDGGTTAI